MQDPISIHKALRSKDAFLIAHFRVSPASLDAVPQDTYDLVSSTPGLHHLAGLAPLVNESRLAISVLGTNALSYSNEMLEELATTTALPYSRALNTTYTHSPPFSLVRKLLFGRFLDYTSSNSAIASNATAQNNTIPDSRFARQQPSWLSEVAALKNLTRSNTINSFVIDGLEGLIITIFVVVAFVLVFLIREWVVQGGNFAAGFNADRPRLPNDENEAQDMVEPQPEPHPEIQQEQIPQVPAGFNPLDNRFADAPPDRLPRRRVSFSLAEEQIPVARNNQFSGETSDNHPGSASPLNRQDNGPRLGSSLAGEASSSRRRPSIPSRDAFSSAAAIHRIIEEDASSASDSWPGVKEFIKMWDRADGNPGEVLRIIEEENLSKQFGWMVKAMHRLQGQSPEITSARLVTGIQDYAQSKENTAERSNDSNEILVHALDAVRHHPSQDLNGISEKGKERSAGDSSDYYKDRESLFDYKFAPESGINQHPENSMKTEESPMSQFIDFKEEKLWEKLWENPRHDHPANTIRLVDWEKLLDYSPDSSPIISREPHNHPIGQNGLTILALNKPTSSNGEALLPAVDTSKRTYLDPQDLSIMAAKESDAWTRRIYGNSTYRHSENPLQNKTAIKEASGLDYSDVQIQDDSNDYRMKHFRFPEPIEPTEEQEEQLSLFGSSNNSTHEEFQEQLQINIEEIPATAPEEIPVRHALRQRPQGLFDGAFDWIWGDVDNANQGIIAGNQQAAQDIAPQPPAPIFVDDPPIPDPQNPNAEEFPDLIEPEPIEEGEDLEGILELIGMHGPLAGLFQNSMFSAFLISATVIGGVWIPYMWGKFVLLVLGNPFLISIKLPLKGLSAFADLTLDVMLSLSGYTIYWIDRIASLILIPVWFLMPKLPKPSFSRVFAESSRSMAEGGLTRIKETLFAASWQISEADFPVFSIRSHESLILAKSNIAGFFARLSQYLVVIYNDGVSRDLRNIPGIEAYNVHRFIWESIWKIKQLLLTAPSLIRPSAFRITFDIPERTEPLNANLAHWNGWDRTIAILTGYLFFALLGTFYLRKIAPFSSSQQGQRIESVIAEILRQAGGVLKVVLIISIEMIMFPLYCGLLLDIALLPLFESATFLSRITFTRNSPWTSIFVHWFVGTCYMFHFSLFITMCRKILRSGVLYFIRDPDDPTFHPVRDVLERSVASQLRKITFSALVYGALVIIGLGSVVWSLNLAFQGILPIHWSSNEPVLEFPVDLLFYNFLMPLAVKVFRPSEGLQAMYSWWFRICARYLRLTQFLFGDRKQDEEGRHVRKSWWNWLSRSQGNPKEPVIGEDRKILAEDREIDPYFLRDGRFVRTPASDQIRIPKGGLVFLEVDENNNRIDGQPDSDDGLHGRNTELFTMVYVPPWFRARIFFFIFLLWIFAAITGVSVTIVPLVFGRVVFAMIIPNHRRMNDVYAFSIGTYILGGLLYAAIHHEKALSWIKAKLIPISAPPGRLVYKALNFIRYFIGVSYVVGAFGFILPSLFSLVMEFYLIIPLHAYIAAEETHIIYIIQDWTLGVLYVKMTGRFILWYSRSRLAVALRGIVRDGWLKPDVRLATRFFIVPAVIGMVFTLLLPLPFAWLVNRYYLEDPSPVLQKQIYRFSYPATLAVFMAIGICYFIGILISGIRQLIRDDVYLRGERLHNFKEQKTSVSTIGDLLLVSENTQATPDTEAP
ncbi:MAG: hypothetical protein M1829_005712 [Trizodia sp. TS-e1964]|nr:MAG: hypothetical protein M1829_005712 [Trizodia sp. TS-e1964]